MDDHTLLRDGLKALIERYDSQHQYEVIFEADNGQDMINKITSGKIPDIILLDITMPLMNGFETAEWLRRNHPASKILAMTMFNDPDTVIKMLKLGARGYLLKNSRVTEMWKAINDVIDQGFYMSEFVSNKMLDWVSKAEQPPKVPLPELSEKEKKFLEYACSEHTYSEIAKKMRVSPKTVEGYREGLFRKFNVGTRVGLVLFAIRNNLYEPLK